MFCFWFVDAVGCRIGCFRAFSGCLFYVVAFCGFVGLVLRCFVGCCFPCSGGLPACALGCFAFYFLVFCRFDAAVWCDISCGVVLLLCGLWLLISGGVVVMLVVFVCNFGVCACVVGFCWCVCCVFCGCVVLAVCA